MSQMEAGFNGTGRDLQAASEIADSWATVPALRALPPGPVLIAGPTASGKSALALHLARVHGGVIINADALQVFRGWPVLTAQPTGADRDMARHMLYGHVADDAPYSVGHWLRDVAPLLDGPERPIIVGGTGLYFTALTQGLAPIPAIPATVRATADGLPLDQLLAGLDPGTRAALDPRNRARVQRAWEVWHSTGRGLADWQAATPPPLLPLDQTTAIVLRPAVPWLNARITQRFDAMLAGDALAEAARMLPSFDPAHLASKAIGAAQLVAHLRGQMSLAQARDAAIIASRQYAKRQRTWLRARMGKWQSIDPSFATMPRENRVNPADPAH